MEHKTWYDDTNDIAYLSLIGDYLLSDVDQVLNNVRAHLEGKSVRQLIIRLDDVTNVANREPREASSVAIRGANVSEVAFVGGSAKNRMIARVLLKTGIVKIAGDFFKKDEQAINWLKSKR